MSRWLPRPVLWLMLCAVLALSACAAKPDQSGGIADVSQVQKGSGYKGIELNPPSERPSFTLTDQTGTSYDFQAHTAGVPTILYFGYTHCPDVCPLILGQIKVALTEVDKKISDQLQVVFVTTDPATDTPEVLAAYLSKFDADLPVKFVGLTGTLAEVEAAQTAAGVPVAEDGGKTHSTMALYYGTSDVARVAWLANTSWEDIVHDLPMARK